MKLRKRLSLLFLWLGLPTAMFAGVADSNTYVPSNYYAFQPPGVGGTYTDADFGTSIKRISNALGTPNKDQGGNLTFITDEYSTMTPFNRDNSRILLVHQSYFALYDGSGNLLKSLPLEIHAQSEPRWSRSDANVFYYVRGNQLKQYNVTTDAMSVVHTFSEYSSVTGKGESDICFDGKHFVFAGDNRYVFVYEISTDSKGPVFDTGGRGFDSLYITPDDNVSITWLEDGTGRYTGIELFSRDMNFLRQLTRSGGHMDYTRDSNGDEVLIWTNSNDPSPICDNGIVKVRLSDGSQTCLLSLDWSLAVHVSAPDSGGWAFVETYAPSDPDFQSAAWKPYTNEIVKVKLDGGQVVRLAHHRSRPFNSYNWTPRVSVSRDGSRLIYSSDYGLQEILGYPSEYSDVYLITGLSGGSTTSPDTTPPTISGVAATSITASSASITWTTSEASDSLVAYGASASYGKSSALDTVLVTSHSQTLSGLAAGTLYHFRVESKDAAGNRAVSGDVTFTTLEQQPPADTTPPSISGVAATGITASGATITWTTNEASDSLVAYGNSASYGDSSALDTALVTSHSQTLSGLASGTLYHFRVESKDAAGNRALSGDGTFTTLAAPPPSCAFSISGTTESFDSSGGAGSVDVTAPAGCNWTATSNDSWITIASGASGSGNGTVKYSVAASTARAPRAGTLTVAGQSLTVTQGAMYTANFPQFANGARWVSSVVLTNPSRTDTASGWLSFFDSQGQPVSISVNGQTPASRIPFTIRPLGSSTFTTNGSGDLVAGSAQASAGIPISGVIKYFHPSFGTAGVPEGAPRRAVMAFVSRDSGEGLDSGIALSNPQAAPVELALSLRGLDGREVSGGSGSLSIPANGHVAKFVHELFPGADTAKFQGSVIVTAASTDGLVSVAALRLGSYLGQFTTLPVVAVDPAPTATDLYFAQFANGGGWSSSLYFANPLGEASTGTLSFLDDGGNPLIVPADRWLTPASAGITIPPRGSAVLSTDGEGALVAGTAILRASSAVGGVLTFARPDLGMATVSGSVPMAAFIIPVARSADLKTSTGVAIASAGTAVKLALTLRNESGEPVPGGNVTLDLPSNGHLARYVEELFPQVDLRAFRGTLTVAAQGGGIVGTALQLGEKQGDLTALPVTELR